MLARFSSYWKKLIVLSVVIVLAGITHTSNPLVFADDRIVDSTPVIPVTVQSSSTQSTEAEGQARNVSNFPQDFADYVPRTLPQTPENSLDPQSTSQTEIEESNLVFYNSETGEETVLTDPVLTNQLKMMVAGGLGSAQEDGSDFLQPLNFNGLSLVGDTTAFPFRRSVKLFFTLDGGGFVCSGTLIDPMHVMTAGHCVHEGDGGVWAEDFTVVPAYDNGARPYGDATDVSLASFEGWTEDGDFDHDIGVIQLNRPIGALTGWHGYGYNSDCGHFTSGSWRQSGYPAADPFNGQFMYTQTGNFDLCDSVLNLWFGNEVHFFRESFGGSSGTGAVRNEIVWAVLSNGNSLTTSNPRLTEGKFNYIRDSFIGPFTPSTYDLIPLDVDATATTIAGGQQLSSMDFVVHNYSSASWSGTVDFSIYLSTNEDISTSDTLLGTSSFNWSFGAKDTVTVNVTSPPTIPPTMSAGTYYLGVIINESDARPFNNDSDGQDAQELNVLLPPPPTADAGGPYVTNEGSPINLFGSATAVLPEYDWRFDNDGLYNDGNTAVILYPDVVQDGINSIGLRVTDHHNRTAFDTTSVTVQNVAPVVAPIADQVLFEGQVLDISTSFSDAGVLDIHNANINWGEGPLELGTVVEAGGAGTVSGSHLYTTIGSYNASVVVRDEDGGVTAVNFTVTVMPGFLQYCVYGQQGGWVVDIAAQVEMDCGIAANSNITISSISTILGDVTSFDGNLTIQTGSLVQGDVEANGKVIINGSEVCGNVMANGNIVVKPNGLVCGDATSSATVNVQSGGTVMGLVSSNTPLSLSSPFAEIPTFGFATSGDDVIVPHAGDMVLMPGQYGRLIQLPQSTTHLSSGEYTFQSVELRQYANMAFDLTGGPIIINVVGDLQTERSTSMSIESGTGGAEDILFKVDRALTLGEKGNYLGTYVVPNFETTLETKATLEGALYGQTVHIGQTAKINGNPATSLLSTLFMP